MVEAITREGMEDGNNSALSAIQRTEHPADPAVQYLRINLPGAHVAMARKFLDRANAVHIFEQMGGEAVPQCMGFGVFSYTGTSGGLLNRPLNQRCMQVMPTPNDGARIDGSLPGGKHKLPAER